MTPAVSKTLEIGLVVLFVALTTTVLLGGVVPDYRRAAGEEVGQRVLVTASDAVERAVPPSSREVTVERRVDLPATIAGDGYRIVVDGRELVLDHPDRRIDGRVGLVLPSRVDRVEGEWQSGAETVVHVSSEPAGLVVELRNGGP